MTLSGWIIMLLSVGATTGFFIACIIWVLQSNNKETSVHGFDEPLPEGSEKGRLEQENYRRNHEKPDNP